MALKRPILVGGLGLSASLWLLETVHFNIFDSSTLLSAMALGTGIWWWRGRDRPSAPPRPIAPPVVDRRRVETQLQALYALIDTLETEIKMAPQGLQLTDGTLGTYRQRGQQLHQALERSTLTVAVVGDGSTGKSTLIQHLEAAFGPAGFAFREVSLAIDSPTPPSLRDDDILLLVTDGDITAPCFQLLQAQVLTGQGALVVFNRADHYDPADQQTILTQLHQRLAALPASVSVVQAIAAPRPIKVRRYQGDGTVLESMETLDPMVEDLHTALETLGADAPTLVAATTLRQVEALRQQVQTTLNQGRRQRAMPLIDQLQWVAGAAAFANPVPTLDLLATVAINGQLIMDLGKIYGFNLSLEEAKTAAGSLASLTVKLGLVELSTQVLTVVLKSHFATYLAGGVVQGMSAAYLTRMAGLSLVDYFEQAALAGTPTKELSWGAIAEGLHTMIQQNRQVSLVRSLVNQGLEILKPTPALAPATAPRIDLGDSQAEAPPLETVPIDASTPEPLTPEPLTPEPLTLELDSDRIPA
jgi:uncharacterized protein (DUF697 family)